VSAVIAGDASVRLVVGGCAALPIRLPRAEQLAAELVDDGGFCAEAAAAVAEAVSADLDPPSDIAGSAAYRRHVAGVLVRRALTGRRSDRQAA
jgi:carbon-monoxide dehydrogenase medium subunit